MATPPRWAGGMRDLICGVALAAVIIGNALFVILVPGGWFVDFEYSLPGFPEAGAPAGVEPMSEAERSELAKTGVRSIRPYGPGAELLAEARRANGSAAFGPEEISHMDDVAAVVRGFAVAWLAGLVLLALLFFVGKTRPGSAAGRDFRRTLRHAAWGVVIATAALGLVMLVAFEPVFDAFHAIFFASGTWRFSEDEALRMLYPDAFWGIAGAVMVALILAQAATVILLTRR